MQKYLDDLERREAARVFAVILDIEANGMEGTTLHLRPIEGKLWELKVSAQRVFYMVVTGPEVVLLHAYRKQSQAAPRREIETARRRMHDVLAEG